MIILILEDNYVRQRRFKEKLIGHEVTIVETSKEAIELLKTKQWDYLFLDHDLGGKVYVQSGENTGWEVAKFLSENRQFMPVCQVITHSLNEAGRKNIVGILPEAIEHPFLWEHIT